MKRILLATTLVVCLLFTMSFAVSAANFSDTSDHWAKNAIDTWAGYEVLKGDQGKFRPDDPIIRAEMAAVINRVIGFTDMGDPTLIKDVPQSEWYYEDILKLYGANIMQGYEGYLRPEDPITREEATVMLARAFEVVDGPYFDPAGFRDFNNISDWARDNIEDMAGCGYVQGSYGYFNPQNNITRAEVVTICDNMVDGFYNTPGEYILGDVENYVLIRTGDVTLKDGIIHQGSLYISAADNGTIRIENVTTSQKVKIYLAHQIELKNVDWDNLAISSEGTTIDTDATVNIGTLVLEKQATFTGEGTIEEAWIYASGASFENRPIALTVDENVSMPLFDGEQSVRLTAANIAFPVAPIVAAGDTLTVEAKPSGATVSCAWYYGSEAEPFSRETNYTVKESDYSRIIQVEVTGTGKYVGQIYDGFSVYVGNVGIDVSEHNDTIDWAKVGESNRIEYVIIRALSYDNAQGKHVIDPQFIANARGAKAEGLDIGAYFYTYATSQEEMAAEVDTFVSVIKQLETDEGISLDLPAFIDFEYENILTEVTTVESRTTLLRSGLERMKQNGLNPGFYSTGSWAYEQYDAKSLQQEGYAVWLAVWGNDNPANPGNPHFDSLLDPDYWQYTSKGWLPGISGDVDLNR